MEVCLYTRWETRYFKNIHFHNHFNNEKIHFTVPVGCARYLRACTGTAPHRKGLYARRDNGHYQQGRKQKYQD